MPSNLHMTFAVPLPNKTETTHRYLTAIDHRKVERLHRQLRFKGALACSGFDRRIFIAIMAALPGEVRASGVEETIWESKTAASNRHLGQNQMHSNVALREEPAQGIAIVSFTGEQDQLHRRNKLQSLAIEDQQFLEKKLLPDKMSNTSSLEASSAKQTTLPSLSDNRGKQQALSKSQSGARRTSNTLATFTGRTNLRTKSCQPRTIPKQTSLRVLPASTQKSIIARKKAAFAYDDQDEDEELLPSNSYFWKVWH